MSVPRRTVQDMSPPFAAELADLCRRKGLVDLADQIGALPVVARCSCGLASCAHFYTAPPPSGSYGPGLTNVILPADRGLILLDIMNGRIVAIDVLDRPDVKRALDASGVRQRTR
jgi:hypothetical protein